MQSSDFLRILTAFADSPADLDLSKGQLLAQVRDEVIQARIVQEHGDLFVEEAGERLSAAKWLIQRVARLPLLADRVLSYIPEPEHFVSPSGHVLDQPDFQRTLGDEQVADAVSTVHALLDRRPAGVTSLLYLTSDAGEGKTTVINHLAREQAKRYKAKETDWLLLPVTLGGRGFLRFDDVVIAGLVNRLRFQLFYYEGFLELVRLGVIVPAFDGFEEMFVESSSGEALSALGNLVRSLSSTGTVLIAARKAYFEYQSFVTQARLFDAIGGDSVAFARVGLDRWTREQFVHYSRLRGVTDPEGLFTAVASRFSDTHPLLTRAVLVRRLVDVATTNGNIESLLEQLGASPQDYFFQFVNAIIEREANEKWIDRSGDPHVPLLTVAEHHDLLAMLASEMWAVSTDVVKVELLDLVADLFNDNARKTPTVGHQVRERLKQHSLLVNANTSRSMYAFDHEDFHKFFLGEALGRLLSGANDSELRRFLQTAVIPSETADAAVHYLHRNGADVAKVVVKLQQLVSGEVPVSFVRENAGAVAIRLAEASSNQPLTLSKMAFPVDSLKSRRLYTVVFIDCYFQPTSLAQASLTNIQFRECRFDRLELTTDMEVVSCELIGSSVGSLVRHDTDEQVFNPAAIARTLRFFHFSLGEITPTVQPDDVDEATKLTERALRIFLRANQVNEGVFRTKLGVRANQFVDGVLPELLKAGILTEVAYLGSGSQRRFRLDVPMEKLHRALESSGGHFSEFLRQFP